jgi:hypothetical protein
MQSRAARALGCGIMVPEAFFMSTTRFPRRGAIAIAAVVYIACGGNVVVDGNKTGSGTSTGTGTGGQPGVPGPYDTCTVSTDCAWGEIDHEILTHSDCVCLFGCPYIPLSQTTVSRRNAQYAQLCTPDKDGQGNPCPIDDCAGPGPIACKAGHCVAQ